MIMPRVRACVCACACVCVCACACARARVCVCVYLPAVADLDGPSGGVSGPEAPEADKILAI